jgi:ring-1,2-phenylacetyl-CoA epoxidase subunit PaaD
LITESEIWKWLEEVPDPEVPVLTVVDLGIIRLVEIIDNKVIITITPTYSGCPAMDAISINIKLKLLEKGKNDFLIKQSLYPAWTTDWMSENGKQKLQQFGIAPPQYKANKLPLEEQVVPCPICQSTNTKLVSAFSSTSCKAFFTCTNCNEGFDYFKCL